jgi:hypothetical protein
VHAVVVEHGRGRGEQRRLGVEDEAVEVEDERVDHA